MNPSSTSFKTTSYTIPVGKWASVSVIPTVFTFEQRTTGTVAVNKWQINSVTVFSGNHTTLTSVSPSSNVTYTMPTETTSNVSFESSFTTSPTSGSIVYNQRIASFAVQTGSTSNSTDNPGECVVSCIGGSITVDGAYASQYFSSALFEKESPSFDVYAGDVIGGVGSYRWFVIEYDI